MTAEEALDRVRSVLCAEFEFDEGEIHPGAHLVDDLDLDSVDAVALAVRLEEEADLTLGEDELKGLRTVADLVEIVRLRGAR